MTPAGARVVEDPRELLAHYADDPEHRGRGLGATATRGVIRRLAGRVDTVVLNVAESNHVARRLYERLGFTAFVTYEEAGLA